MLIRTQNKRGLVVLENCDSICIQDCKGIKYVEIYAYNGSEEDSIFLGGYANEAKAEKVLDKIQNAYSVSLMQKCFWSGNMPLLMNTSQELKEEVIDAHMESDVFQMPEDSEV